MWGRALNLWDPRREGQNWIEHRTSAGVCWVWESTHTVCRGECESGGNTWLCTTCDTSGGAHGLWQTNTLLFTVLTCTRQSDVEKFSALSAIILFLFDPALVLGTWDIQAKVDIKRKMTA